MKKKIRGFNKTVQRPLSFSLCTVYNFEKRYTEIYLPGDFRERPEVIGYITRENKIVYF